MSFFFLVLYVAFLFVRPQEWVLGLADWQFGSLGIQDLLILLAVAGALADLRRGLAGFREVPQNFLILGLLAGVAMSHVSHFYFAGLLDSLEKFGKVVLVFLLVTVVVNTPRRVKTLAVVMVAASLFLAAQGIVQFHRGYGFGGPADLPLSHGGVVRVRATGIFNDPNDLALMLVTIMPFLGMVVVTRNVKFLLRLTALAALVPVAYAVYLTNSRGGWVALGAMGVAFVTLAFSRRIGLVLVAVFLAAIIALRPTRLEGISANHGRDRLVLWGYGNQMLKQNPFFGVGMNQFTEQPGVGHVAHNSFVHTYAELGMFGYFFWLGLVVGTFWDTWALRRAQIQEGSACTFLPHLSTAILAGFCGFMVAAFFLTRCYVLPLYLIMALVVAMRMIYHQEHGSLVGGFQTRHLKWVAASAILSVPGMWLLIRIVA